MKEKLEAAKTLIVSLREGGALDRLDSFRDQLDTLESLIESFIAVHMYLRECGQELDPQHMDFEMRCIWNAIYIQMCQKKLIDIGCLDELEVMRRAREDLETAMDDE